MTLSRLMYRPLPLAGEGLQGYLLRVIEGNRLPTSIKVFGRTCPTIKTICERLDRTPEEVQLQPVLRQLNSSRNGPNPLWNYRTTRYCPQCLSEAIIFRQEWELALSTCCTKHQVRLLENCHHCGQVLTSQREALDRCRCGVSLSHGETSSADPRELACAEILEAQLRGDGAIPEHLQLLSLEQVHRLFVFFGAYAGQRKKPMKISEFLSLSTAQPIVQSASEVLLDWPNGFHILLEKLREKQGNDEVNPKFSKAYGAFYQYLYTRFKEEVFGFLFHAFELYLEERWDAPLTERNQRLSVKARQNHVWITLGSAARTLAVSRRKLQGYIKAGKIRSRSFLTAKGREQVYVDRRELPIMKGLIEEVMDLKTTAAVLGLPKRRAKELIELGTFKSALPPRARNAATWAISREAIELCVDWNEALPVLDEPQTAGLISLTRIFKYHLPIGHLFHRMMVPMLKDELKVHGRLAGVHGMSGWLLNKDTFLAWLRQQHLVGKDGAVPIPEAARRIKANQETTYHLAAWGFLMPSASGDRSCLTINLDEIERFQRTYVFSSEIAATIGTSSKMLVAKLRKLGVTPVSGPTVDRGRRYLYLRNTELETATRLLGENHVPTMLS